MDGSSINAVWRNASAEAFARAEPILGAMGRTIQAADCSQWNRSTTPISQRCGAACAPITGEFGRKQLLGGTPKVSFRRVFVAHLEEPADEAESILAELLDVLLLSDDYAATGRPLEAERVVSFLVAERANPGSVISAIAIAKRELRRAEQNLFAIKREIQDIDNRIERFKARFVKSPCDGTVFRISANASQGGQLVKEGDELAVIVPDTQDRVVELMINGVDAPLIAAHMEQTGRGPHVRLQFEGWPAIQFAGWPSVAIGTFGGRVRQMDPTDDGQGRFRILVEPEEMFEGDQWPEGLYLRQGNHAVGWVFLNRVTLGFELWRQFNGFPPVVAPKPPDKNESKPPKVQFK